MANNRLYIFDPETNKAVIIAKRMGAEYSVPALYSEDNRLALSIDKFFKSIDHNAGYSDYDETKLELLVEAQLPKNVQFITDI